MGAFAVRESYKYKSGKKCAGSFTLHSSTGIHALDWGFLVVQREEISLFL